MNDTQQTKPPVNEPTPSVVPPAQPQKTQHAIKSRTLHKVWKGLGLAVVCASAGFIGAWLFAVTGFVTPDISRTITDNSQVIVSQQGEVVADVFKKVSPSTVAITTRSVDTTRRLFSGTPQVREGAGSGIIISDNGYIMTNKHVIPEGTDNIMVITHDGTEYEDVQVVGRDPSNDIAFLKVNNPRDFTPAIIGNSDDVIPGQQVMAIGNALGMFRNSITTGIISGTGRPVTASDATGAYAEQLDDMFQTDAAINPGNSGGPLVNVQGEVIGMNTAVADDGQSIGFAIPVNDAKVLIHSVLSKGRISKAYLGVRYVPLTPEVAEQIRVQVGDGALVSGGNGQPAVATGSPAAQAGLQQGDVITKVDGRQILAGKGLASLLSRRMPGDTVELTFIRNGQEQKVKVQLAEFPV